MSKPGNYTAYQQYKPQDNGTVQALQHWSGFAEQKRQNDLQNKRRDEIVQNEEEKKNQEWVDGLLKLDSIKATGVSGIDDLNANIAAKTYEERTALVEKIQTLKPRSSEYIKTMGLLNSNANIIKEINQIKNNILENAKKYSEGRDSAYTADPTLDSFYKNVEKSEIVIDPKTQKPVVLVEDPKDATKKITLTYQDILNGKGDFKLTPKFDRDKFIKDNAEILNKKPPTTDRIDSSTGYLITEEGYDDDKINQIAKNMFSDSDGNPTEYAISFSKQKGIHDLEQIKSPENLAKLAEEFITDITPLLVDKNKIKTNNIQSNKEKLALEYAKLRQQNQKLSETTGLKKEDQKKKQQEIDIKREELKLEYESLGIDVPAWLTATPTTTTTKTKTNSAPKKKTKRKASDYGV